MSRYKGMSRRQTVTAADLAEIVDCHRRIQAIHARLNYASPQQLPLLAASATLKACWAELSGAAGQVWGYPATAVPADGVPPQMRRWVCWDALRNADGAPHPGVTLDSTGG